MHGPEIGQRQIEPHRRLDRCLLPLAGKPLLAHVIERLKPQVSELIVNANGDPARFSGFGLPVVSDRLGDHAGPLAGIQSGLEWTRANRPKCRYVTTAASDTPFLPADLVSRCRAAIDEDNPQLVVARTEEGRHPTFGLWPVSLASHLAESIEPAIARSATGFEAVVPKR